MIISLSHLLKIILFQLARPTAPNRVLTPPFLLNRQRGRDRVSGRCHTENTGGPPQSVPGTRSFGLQDLGSGYLFYTQGADRLTGNADAFAAWLTGLGNTANGIQFTSADALWEKTMRNVGLLLDPNNNPYSVGTPAENRPKFADILSAIQDGRPLSTVPCN